MLLNSLSGRNHCSWVKLCVPLNHVGQHILLTKLRGYWWSNLYGCLLFGQPNTAAALIQYVSPDLFGYRPPCLWVYWWHSSACFECGFLITVQEPHIESTIITAQQFITLGMRLGCEDLRSILADRCHSKEQLFAPIGSVACSTVMIVWNHTTLSTRPSLTPDMIWKHILIFGANLHGDLSWSGFNRNVQTVQADRISTWPLVARTLSKNSTKPKWVKLNFHVSISFDNHVSLLPASP